ncbi:MAG: mannosyltransferase family protein [Gaiellaceae bacterium]
MPSLVAPAARTLVSPAAAEPQPRVIAYRQILLWWIGSRALVAAAVGALSAIGGPAGFFGRTVIRHPLRILYSWDGHWYWSVAQHGYLYVPGQESNPAFFPLFPVLLRLLAPIGIDLRVVAVLIANVALPVALLALYELGREVLSEPLARRASILAAVFPTGVVFSMAYPQSLVLAAVAFAGVFALRGHWTATAMCLGVGTLARPECLFVAIPVAVIAAKQWHRMSPLKRGTAIGAVLAAPAALSSYVIYLAWTLHDPWAWSHAQLAWGRSFQLDGLIILVLRLPGNLAHNPWLIRDVVAVFAYAALLVVARRVGVPRSWLIAAVLVLLLPLFSGSVQSEARFGLLAPPVYWGLAALAHTPKRDTIVRTLCLLLLCAATITIPDVFP